GSGAPAPAARRPGGWPTAGAGAGPAGPGPQQAEPQGPGRPQGQAQPQAAPATPPPGAVDARALWPNVLEAVKNRRRFTWILLSQNAHVAGFDGTTLQLGFLNAGARDNFASSGSEDVLKQALSEEFQVSWKIETVIDASGGQGPATPPGGGGGGGWGQAPAQPRPAAPAPAPAPAPPQPVPAAPPTPAPAPQGPSAPQREQRPPAPEPPRRTTSIEDDIPEEDDPDLDESALSGHDLIMRELGATVVEEYTNE
ncbi:DNA polymerase III subunit gamma and tau, partial [Streptomyces albidoflavus]